ncbi:cell death activator CIDE-B isoform X2 [Latimeria chalumnae]
MSSVGSQLTKRVLSSSAPPQRPFRVCNHDRSVKKGLTAGTQRELVAKAMDALLLTSIISLVLEEDGTMVENEDFFEMLDDDTTFMALQKGQRWTPAKNGAVSYSFNQKPKNSKDIARITFDIYKLNPRDIFGSLNVNATFYGLYSMSCDFKCLGPKKVLREMLRVASTLTQAVGQVFLMISTFIRRIVEGPDQWQHARISEYSE